MESAQTLDFVSLLVSKHVPKATETTLSPYVRENLPPGSLCVETIQQSQKSEAEKHNEELVTFGWRMQSLGNAADSLLELATRLEQEVERETKYWEGVLAVKDEGWPLCHLPGERRTLGVRFGSAEGTSPELRNRGTAALRRDEDGAVMLDRGPGSSDSMLRICISRKGKPGLSSQESVSTEILSAHDCLLDQELQHEMLREARSLVNQNVRCLGNTIIIPLEPDEQISIELEPLSQPHDSDDSDLPNALLLALRLLLCHAHRQSIHRRSQPPPSIQDTPIPRPLYSILRPIVELLQHRSALNDAHKFLTSISRVIKSLRMHEVSFTASQESSTLDLSTLLSKNADTSIPAQEALINALTRAHQSIIEMDFPSHQMKLRLDISTNILSPVFGTAFTATVMKFPSDSVVADMPKLQTFSLLSKVEKHILQLLTQDLMLTLISNPVIMNDWVIRGPYENKLVRKGQRAGEDVIEINLSRVSLEIIWEIAGTKDRMKWTGEEELEKGQGIIEFIKSLTD